MENKNTKYFLFLAIIAIWGLFGYRLYERVKPEQDILISEIKESSASSQVSKVDSFSLLLGYKDPFKVISNHPAHNPKKESEKKPPKKVIEKKPPPSKPFPTIIYKGNLKLKPGKTVALLAIDDKNAHLETGESYKDVLVTKIYEDSIKISFLKEEKTILKVRL